MTELSGVVVGSVVDRVLGHRLSVCPHCRPVFYSAEGRPRVYNVLNLCVFDRKHCDFGGKRLKFASYGIDSLRVVWICPKALSLGVDVHG